jgi:hypothetical protein
MLFFWKKKLRDDKVEESIQSIRRNNLKRANKSIEKIKKPAELLELYKDDVTMKIFLATGGDKRK